MRKFINAVLSENADVVLAPNPVETTKKRLFLSGSIDQGKAEPWQERVCEALSDLDVTILNPRRDNWDDTWEQDISNEQFREQVLWELDNLDESDVICVYFDPKGQAPITLMELGLHARDGKAVVCCPKGYWRRGNVQVVCAKYGIPLVDELPDLISALRERLA